MQQIQVKQFHSFYLPPLLKVALVAFMFMLLSQQAWSQTNQLNQNFRDVEIANVIEAVAKVTGHNFIIDPRVRGKVTLIAPEAMSPESLYQTLLAILNVHGFVAVPSGEVIKVIPANLARDQLPYSRPSDYGEAWVTEVVVVEHVEASKLVAILRPLVAREGHLVALAESNRLIMTDTVDGIERIKAILDEIDIRVDAEVDVIQIKHAPVEELARSLSNVFPEGQANPVKVSFDQRSNRLILSGDAQSRLSYRAIVAELDVPLAKDGRLQVVYLQYAKAADLVPLLQNLASNQSLIETGENAAENAPEQGAEIRQRPRQNNDLQDRISIQADERMNAVIISAPPEVIVSLRSVIQQLDIRRAQVLIEAIIVEISETKSAQLGVDWASLGPSGIGLLNLSGNLPGVLAAGASGDAGLLPDGVPGRGLTAAVGQTTSTGGWGALINALRNDSGANILSTPTLLTLDNEEAEIIVGREVPFRTGNYSTASGGSNPFTTIERKNVGLKLKVRPQINQGNEVYLDIENEISDVLPTNQDAADLETSKRQLKTSVIVGDGDTIVLGGLLSERETDNTSRVPGLSSIPLLGSLFRFQGSQREKVNLMIFLRPVIVRDQNMGNYYSRKKYQQIQQHQDQMHESESALIQGLRPKLPTLEQMDEGKATAPDKGRQAEPVAETATSASVEQDTRSAAERRRDSSLEALGF